MLSKVRFSGLVRQTFNKSTRNFANKIIIPSGKTITFPLNLNGVPPASAEKNQFYQSALEQILDTDIQEGFKLAYKSTLDALINNDLEFFQDICEPRLYEEIQNGLDALKEAGLSADGDHLDTDDVSVMISSLSMIYGVSHDRSKNQDKDQYFARDMNFNGIEMKFYQPRFPDPNMLRKLYPFLQISCTFYSSPINFVIKDKEGNPIAGLQSNKYHKFVFESVNESGSDGIGHIQNIAKSMTGLFGAIGMFGNHNAMKTFIQNLFNTKELTWKIADIDDHLNGNPFTS